VPEANEYLEAHPELLEAGVTASLLEGFQRAVRTGDAGALRRLLGGHPAARPVLDAPTFSFDSPALVHVSGGGDLRLIDALLELGADPNRRSDWWAGGWHALHAATGEVAERLLGAGAVPDACAAAHLDDLALLGRLLDEDPSLVHERGGDGQTPLHFARSREAADLLLSRGADPDARDVDHRGTPAEWMLVGRRGAGRYDLAGHLVERGASADVFLAAALGLVERLRELLQADPSLPERRTGQGEYGEKPPSSYHIYTWSIGQDLSPLQVARRFGQEEAARVLGAFASPKERFLAACMGADRQEVERLLAERPGLLQELTPRDQRALPDAGWAGHAAAVALMLDLGFDPATPRGKGDTVLHCAAWEGSPSCVEVALRHEGVRTLVNEPDGAYGGTPLGWCCHGARYSGNLDADHPAIARLLLEAGARSDVNLEGVPEGVAAVIRGYRRD